MKKIIFAVILILLSVSCTKRDYKGIYSQGRIEYRITYLNAEDGNFDPALLPKKMVLSFNEDYCTNTIEGFMGFFKLENLTYFGKKKSSTYLKVLDKNYIFNGDKQELMCCFDTKVICGLMSKHAIAKIPRTGDSFEIYYTYDITLEHPNVTNPYIDIDGVLTDFVLFMGPYKMRFQAQKFEPSKGPADQMKVPKDAIEVTRNEMVYALERLMN